MLVVLPLELLQLGQIDPVELDARLRRELWQDLDARLAESDRGTRASEVVALEEGEIAGIGALESEAVADLDVLELVAARRDPGA